MTKDIRIGIIGGLGKMGRWFRRFFEELGYTVSVADQETTDKPEDLAQTCQVVLLAVPLQHTVPMVRAVGPLVQDGALLTDIASLKSDVVRTMLEVSSASVIGTHPLFGPGEPNITGQTVVMCPGRGQRWQDWLTGIFVEGGARVEIVSPEIHDYYMAVIQGLTHFSTLALGLTIDSLDLDLMALKRFATPAFHRRLTEISHLLSQDADLYAAMPMLNSTYGVFYREFERIILELKGVIAKKDIEEFIRLFARARGRFG
ncbi:MAG: prephenate dehydrogenase/arogenate dehydrogenase family protein [Deltaproteobacteria bacterium]|nr:MAG: prephenate dehydrogenase/arogenate dehydrogenase family protein [Deltaproteobacteria bacterium]